VTPFMNRMEYFRTFALPAAVEKANAHYALLRQVARKIRGDAYAEADYPATLVGSYGFDVGLPSSDPPDYLKQLNPTLWKREQERMRAQFDEVIAMTEQMFVEQLLTIVDALRDKCQKFQSGESKRLHDTAIENFGAFFKRFKELDIGSNAKLRIVVEECENLMQGITPEKVKTSGEVRSKLIGDFDDIRSALHTMMIDGAIRETEV